jgi:hypothetical protein
VGTEQTDSSADNSGQPADDLEDYSTEDDIEGSSIEGDPENTSEEDAEAPSVEEVPIVICSVALRLADNGQLLAELAIDESEIPIPVTLISLKAQFAAEEFCELWVDEDALPLVINKAAAGEPGREVIGERRHAKADIVVVSNKMIVHADLTKAYLISTKPKLCYTVH